MTGLCECGCGGTTSIAKANSRHGYLKGEPVRFLVGHARRGKSNTAEHRLAISKAQRGVPKTYTRRGSDNPAWKGDSGTYAAFHWWLRTHHPKTGVCESCQKNAGTAGCSGTHYALIRGRKYTRNRSDYYELCPACHCQYDRGLKGIERAGINPAKDGVTPLKGDESVRLIR